MVRAHIPPNASKSIEETLGFVNPALTLRLLDLVQQILDRPLQAFKLRGQFRVGSILSRVGRRHLKRRVPIANPGNISLSALEVGDRSFQFRKHATQS